MDLLLSHISWEQGDSSRAAGDGVDVTSHGAAVPVQVNTLGLVHLI